MKRMQKCKLNATFGAATTGAVACPEMAGENGEIVQINLTVPNFTNSVTITQIDAYDADGKNVYSNNTGWTKNAEHYISGLKIPCYAETTVKVTISGAAGGTGDVVEVDLHVEAVRM